jgi:hypothetical protein
MTARVSATIFYAGEEVYFGDISMNGKESVTVWGSNFSIIGTAEDLELLAKDILEGVGNIRKERADRKADGGKNELSQRLDNAVNFFTSP